MPPWQEESPLAAGVGAAAAYLQGKKQAQDTEYERQQDAIKNAIAMQAAQSQAQLRGEEGQYYGARAQQTSALTDPKVQETLSHAGYFKAMGQSALQNAITKAFTAAQQSQHWQRLDANAKAKVSAQVLAIQEKWQEAVAKNKVSVEVASIRAAAEIQSAVVHAGATTGAASIRAKGATTDVKLQQQGATQRAKMNPFGTTPITTTTSDPYGVNP